MSDHVPTDQSSVIERLNPLATPPPLPALPHNTDVCWTWRGDDPASRVLYADVTGLTEISGESLRFFAMMMDRDDFALITLGMVEGLDKKKIKNFLRSAFPSNQPYNFFRHYKKEHCEKADHVRKRGENESDETGQSFREQNGSLRMGVHDFLDFLDATETLACDDDGTLLSERFVAYDGDNQEVPVVPGVDLLYMFDVDCPKLLHGLDDAYKRAFKLKEALPRGEWCMMNNVSAVNVVLFGKVT